MLRVPSVRSNELAVRHQPEVVRGRVALVDADRVRPYARRTSRSRVADQVERLVPADLAPRVAVARHRPAQPIRIVVQVGERRRLRTDVALAERIVLVAADRRHAVAVGRTATPQVASQSGQLR